MPYNSLKDLPENVKQVLPKHAREIYLAAFNNAWDEYRDDKDRKSGLTREETAHKVAWAAVKNKYKKSGNKWVSK